MALSAGSCNGSHSTPAPVDSAPRPAGTAARGEDLSEERFRLERERLVDYLSRSIKDQRVLEAMRRVPRHEFVPPAYRHRSYEDTALPIAEGQTISQPYVVALMTELLDLDGDEKVLEVGTGSGYQAAILGELAAEVYTIEIRPRLKEEAERRLKELKRRGVLNYRKLVVILGDGSKGYPDAAPYDCILVTAAPARVPTELLNQLKPGGRLVIPVGKVVQELQLIEKSLDGKSFSTRRVDFVRFVPLVEGEEKSGVRREPDEHNK